MSLEKMRLRVNIGAKQFVVNCADYTYERALELAEKVAEVRRKNSLFAKYPMEPGESRERWRDRVQPLLAEDELRKDGETVEKHLARLFESRVDTHENSFDILNAIAEVFGLDPVSKDEFKKVNWLEIKAFIYDVLNLGDVPADDFLPNRPLRS